jgi:hypothetical protein
VREWGRECRTTEDAGEIREAEEIVSSTVKRKQTVLNDVYD